MQGALESALAELTLGPALDPSDRKAVASWLDRHGVSDADARALENTLERLLVYRRLVQGNLREALQLAIPRAMARLGATFDQYFARFLAERGPRTHYLRDVTWEFLDWAEPAFRSDPRVAPYILDLARHEALQIEIGSFQGTSRGASDEARPEPLDLDRGVTFVAASKVVRYDFAVHKLSDNETDRTEPERTATALFVYRSPEHEVRYLELSTMAALILEKLHAEGRTLRQAMLCAAERQGLALNEAVLDGAAQLLADLAERGALLGPTVPADST